MPVAAIVLKWDCLARLEPAVVLPARVLYSVPVSCIMPVYCWLFSTHGPCKGDHHRRVGLFVAVKSSFPTKIPRYEVDGEHEPFFFAACGFCHCLRKPAGCVTVPQAMHHLQYVELWLYLQYAEQLNLRKDGATPRNADALLAIQIDDDGA